MKIKLLLVPILVSVVSCGQESGDPLNVSSELGSIIKAEALLKDEELTVAQKICYALRTKRTKFKSDFIGDTFNFQVNHGKCAEGTDSSYAVISRLRNVSGQGPMIFDSNNLEFYYSNVQTNQEGELSTICSGIFASLNVSNTLQVNQRQKKQISFHAHGLYSNFKVNYAEERPTQNGSQFVVYKSEVYQVKTAQDNTNGDLLGMVETIEKVEECPAGSVRQTSSFKQVFTSKP